MAHLDIDAVKAEANHEPHTVKMGGKTFSFPPRLPMAVLDIWTTGDDRAGLKMLLGKQWPALEKVINAGDFEDFQALMQGVVQMYGVTAGESQASGNSSKSSGASSRPTSRGSTGSTSVKRAGGRSRSASAAS